MKGTTTVMKRLVNVELLPGCNGLIMIKFEILNAIEERVSEVLDFLDVNDLIIKFRSSQCD